MWTDQTLSWLALIRLLLCVGCHNQTRKLSVSGPAFAATVAGRVGPPEQHLYAGMCKTPVQVLLEKLAELLVHQPQLVVRTITINGHTKKMYLARRVQVGQDLGPKVRCQHRVLTGIVNSNQL